MHGHRIDNAGAGNRTLQELGFSYVNLDASWNLPTRDAAGNWQPDPKLFPLGLNHTIDYVHNLGLGFGLYARRSSAEHLVATKALRCTATARKLTVAESFAKC